MTSPHLVNFVRFLLALVTALAAALAIQFAMLALLMTPSHFGIDMSQWPLELQNWMFYSSEATVAFGGIIAAGLVAPPARRLGFCSIITLCCLGISLTLEHMVGKGHGLPNPGWVYYLGDPILHSFAFGGVVGILYFGLLREKLLPDLKMRRS